MSKDDRMRAPRRTLTAAAVAVLLVAPAGSSLGGAEGGEVVRRRIGGPSESVEGLAIAERSRPVAASAGWIAARKTTVDDHTFTGAENAVYAPTRGRVFVAFKRFLRDPSDPGGDYVPAQLRVRKSSDGGRTWSGSVVDPEATEAGDLIDRTVAIGGNGRDVVYIAYIVQTGGTAEDGKLRLARSNDGGETWDVRRVAGSVGGYVSMRVESSRKVLIAAKRAGGSEPLWMFGTTNGGRDWVNSQVDTYGWFTSVDSGPSGRIWVSYYNPGTTSLHSATSTSPAGPWTPWPVAGQGSDPNYTGLGGSLDVARNGDVYVAFEEFQQGRGRSVVKVSRSTDAGESWVASRVQAATYIGWDVTVHVVGHHPPDPDDAFVAYWYSRPNPLKGRARIAHSVDEGATWTPWTISERRYVEPYLDLATPTAGVQYVSYQTRDPDKGTILRIARIEDL